MSAPTNDVILAKAQNRMDVLLHEDESLATREDAIRERRAAVQSELAELRRFAELYRQFAEPNGSKAPGQLSAALVADPTVRLADLAVELIRAHGGSAKVADIRAWLQEIGRLPRVAGGARRQYSTLFTVLDRDSRVARSASEKGTFVLGGGHGIIGADGHPAVLGSEAPG